MTDYHFTENYGGGEEPTSREITIAIIPKITASLSFLGSLWILIDVFRDRKKLGTTYHRLVLGMSITDFIASIALAFTSRPIPANTPEPIWGATGTVGTCVVQGFFVQLGGLATPLYSAFLAVYYLMVVRYGWKDDQCEMRQMETIMHTITWILAIGTSIVSLVLDLYNSANIWCWIAPYPLGCDTGSVDGDKNIPCERGGYAYIYRFAFYFLWLWIALFTVIISMALVYHKVWSQAQAMKKYNHGGIFSSGSKNVQKVATQATLYVASFFFTALFPSVARGLQASMNCTTTYFPLTLFFVIFFPLQGFWNFFIYMRPRLMRYRSTNSDWQMSRVWKEALRRTLYFKASDGSSYSNDKDYQDGVPTIHETNITTHLEHSGRSGVDPTTSSSVMFPVVAITTGQQPMNANPESNSSTSPVDNGINDVDDVVVVDDDDDYISDNDDDNSLDRFGSDKLSNQQQKARSLRFD